MAGNPKNQEMVSVPGLVRRWGRGADCRGETRLPRGHLGFCGPESTRTSVPCSTQYEGSAGSRDLQAFIPVTACGCVIPRLCHCHGRANGTIVTQSAGFVHRRSWGLWDPHVLLSPQGYPFFSLSFPNVREVEPQIHDSGRPTPPHPTSF